MNENGLDPRTSTYGRKTRGAVAGMARKHCSECGRTLPNRARSAYCKVCYPEAVRDRDLAYKEARAERDRLQQAVAILSQGRGGGRS